MRLLLIIWALLATGLSVGLAAEPVTVFVVHGTYGAGGRWVQPVDGKITFASELRRGLEGECEIQPFLWRTSIHHATRVEAAKRLADQIDRPEFANSRVILVGHSHGGNVCLEAAGRCQRKIETVVCLSTPHLFLQLKGIDDEIYHAPIYCSPQTRRNVDRILSVVPRHDPVVETYADFRKGLTEQTAIAATYDWRKLLNDPRLPDDGGPVQELIEDLVGVKLTDNLGVDRTLSVADEHIDLAAEGSGIDLHEQVHSGRVGYLLGWVLKQGCSPDALTTLRTLLISADADRGELLEIADYVKWWESHAAEMSFAGWVLRELTITGKPGTKLDDEELTEWDWDDSRPDVAFRLMRTQPAGEVGRGGATTDAETGRWSPWLPLSRAERFHLLVVDEDLFGGHDEMGTLFLNVKSEKVSPANTFEGKTFSGTASWLRVHR